MNLRIAAALIVAFGLPSAASIAQYDGSVWLPNVTPFNGGLTRITSDGVVTTYPNTVATCVAYDGAGHVYAADTTNNEIAIYDTSGKVGAIPWVGAATIYRCPDGTYWVSDVPAAGTFKFTRIDGAGNPVAGPVTIAAPLYTPGSGRMLDPPYSVPTLPLAVDSLLAASLRNPPLRPAFGGMLDANGDASATASLGSAFAGMTLHLSAVLDSRSSVSAATTPVAVTMP